MIYPVAIKYDAKFGYAFWNSSRYSIVTYLLMMMTSWAIVVDVWYLPPMQMKKVQKGNLSYLHSYTFLDRVKAQLILQRGSNMKLH